jgi:hypothetical protein
MPPPLFFLFSGKPLPLVCRVEVLCLRKLGDVSWIQSLFYSLFGVGFAAGYGVREWKSRKRRRRHAYARETADEVSGDAAHHPAGEQQSR